jgi:hypothetical protein
MTAMETTAADLAMVPVDFSERLTWQDVGSRIVKERIYYLRVRKYTVLQKFASYYFKQGKSK